MNIQIEAIKKTWETDYRFLGVLLVFLFFIPTDWSRVEFFLAMLIPVLFSYKYFQLEVIRWKPTIAALSFFIVANMSTFIIHVWQLEWEIANPNGLFGWQLKLNPLLYAIPYNDGMWLRQLAHPAVDHFFYTIYIHGFIAAIFTLAIYYALTAQPLKIVHAAIAGHFLQYILILPFHFWVDGHQVWLIQNMIEGTFYVDPLKGYRTVTEPIIPSLNHVFPSMHTSIATVAIILAWRERGLALKYFMVLLNVAIIISTVYLGIHWVVDIFGGIMFGYFCLKLADKIMRMSWLQRWREKLT